MAKTEDLYFNESPTESVAFELISSYIQPSLASDLCRLLGVTGLDYGKRQAPEVTSEQPVKKPKAAPPKSQAGAPAGCQKISSFFAKK